MTEPITAPTGVLEYLDPNALVLDTNVRDDAALSEQFIASIAEHGVIVPLAAIRRPGGTEVIVRDGQRRLLAARQVGLATVPVCVQPYDISDTAQDTAARIAQQIVTNDHKHDLTDAQRARGIQEMLTTGLSITKVAKQLSVKKQTVTAAQAASRSDAALAALDNGQLTLEEAAAFAEFEDMPGALDRLSRASGDPRFVHVVAQLREERIEQAAYAKAVVDWTERGYTVLEDRPAFDDPNYVSYHRLRTADGERVDPDEMTLTPAHWAVTLTGYTGYADAQTGQIIDENDVDWDAEDTDTPAAQGKRHPNTLTEALVFEATQYYCLDVAAAGLTMPAHYSTTGTTSSTGATDGQAAEDRAEAESRERRKVLALNKLGQAAEGVRRTFVTTLLARKTPPAGASVFAATVLARCPNLLADYRTQAIAANLLNLPEDVIMRDATATVETTGDARAQMLILGMVCGALETALPKDAWRGSAYHHQTVPTFEYLQFLTRQGYTLADVERIVTGERVSDAVYDQHIADKAAH
ncbi:ParB N-terminal domain-containing protein [Mycobacterium sp. M1]|uniref:ParB N-terminal domain-containing protein n=1 Tax=Mycolicibacter acidiphilus TaxID=2835306 RepID=A0ABS5RN26_9MYCO|nr:ParB/RepB/Spo0J family partition protein [Mycolicibacter acidiphilus]MBS9535589.1 ParB N-terminal domain-containing protein [Mycolicibacter acidiphilus]